MLNSRVTPNIGCQKSSGGLVNSFQPVASPANLISLLGFTNGAAAQYLQLWDAASPSDANAVLLLTIEIPQGPGSFSLDTPVQFSRGILLVNSSVPVMATPTTTPGGTSYSGGSTNGTTTVTMTSTAGLYPGSSLSGQDIPAGATVVSVTDSTHVVISAAATGTHSSQTYTGGNLQLLTRHL